MANVTCSIVGCEKKARNAGGRRWCSMHEERHRKHGDVDYRTVAVRDDVCIVEGCDQPHEARGWCSKHYTRWVRNGTTDSLRSSPKRTKAKTGRPLRLPAHHRILRNISQGQAWECWEWQGTTGPGGYGFMTMNAVEQSEWGVGRIRQAYRVAYEVFVGPIPDGLHLDHLCRNPPCVNPYHLEPVTHRENVLRGESACAKHARKTHCIRGHEFNEENTYHPPTGGRRCQVCVRDRRRKQRPERKERLA